MDTKSQTQEATAGAANMEPAPERIWHKRLPDFESFDKITLEVIPRYKTSGLSGDEWRQHIEVEFWFKGHVVHRAGFRDMETALMLMGAEFIKAQEPIPDAVIKVEEDTCDQPSCCNPPVYRYVLKEEYSSRGDKLDASDIYSKKYRQFCEKHKTRGDCGREDSDDNYEIAPI